MTRRTPMRGMTLVELMVGLAIGMFVVAVMGTLYVGSKTTFNSQESVSRLEENSRFAVDVLANDLRMAGFRGCNGRTGALGALVNTLNTPTALPYNFSRGVTASHYTGSAWLPALDSTLSALSPSTAGDVVTVYRPNGTGLALTSEMSDGSSDLKITSTSAITSGDLLVVTDCAGAAVLQATNANPGTSGTIEHKTGVSGISPGVSTANLGRAFLQDALVYRAQAISYYLAASVRQPGLLALWSNATPGYGQSTGPVELITGVERMALTFGLDTNGDQAADQFVSADSVADWTQVVSTRLELLLSGPDNNTTTTPQSYVFAGATVTPTDRRMRTVVSIVSSLRNAVP